MQFTRLLASLPVVAIVVATGCADGPLEGVRPVKYVKIDEANATTTREPPPKEPASPKRDPVIDDRPAGTATTSAASSSTEPVEPDELINAAAGKKPGKGGKPPKPVGGTPKSGPPTDEKCYRVGRECCGEPLEEGPTKGKGGAKECPKGSVLGGACPKKRCKGS